MAINFYKNHDQIVSAYKEVLDAKCSTNWAIFGYDKQSNDLALVAKGDTGLQELQNELSQSKILYAFCEVKDDSLNLRRYLLINWQGECAPLQRKGICMNHFADVRSFFKDANIVLNARHEEDVEPEVLMQHVNKLASRIRIDKQTNGTHNLTTNGNDRHDNNDSDDLKPVGTNYQRTVAQREISLKERERFWHQQKIEEEQRLKEEKMKQTANRYDPKTELQHNCQTGHQESPIKTNQSQLLPMHVLFEQNSSTPTTQQQQQIDCQSQSTKSAASNYVNHVQSMLFQKQPESHSNKEQQKQPISVPNEEVDDVVEKVIESNQNCNDGVEDESSSDDSFHTNPTVDDQQQQQQQQYGYYAEPRQLENIEEEQNEEDDEAEKRKEELETVSQGLRAKALYDYQAADDTEISFDPDDIITHIEQIDAGWWQGLAPNGAYGLFPANYVELLDN
ncbi:drebrin-like protein b-like protein [Dermatophagoides farinae]|uniref:Drebrin-like protein b-like protein n=1 Tax=Dermatophagoides farinae TaxID=6954 RepID=A0A9D4SES5_DERFA|nr:drebrin-like protein b-like protein [Dermatophagoides farinae]